MKVAVLVKQIPQLSEVTVGAKGPEWPESSLIINPFDEYAVEEAVRLKERIGGKVTVISMGPPQAESALRETLSRGTAEAILISDRAFAGADTLATAYTLSMAIRKIDEYDFLVSNSTKF